MTVLVDQLINFQLINFQLISFLLSYHFRIKRCSIEDPSLSDHLQDHDRAGLAAQSKSS